MELRFEKPREKVNSVSEGDELWWSLGEGGRGADRRRDLGKKKDESFMALL